MVDFVCYGQGDARTLDLYNFARGSVSFIDQTATSFKAVYGDGEITEFQGYGFVYDPSTGAPIDGTTTYGLRSVNGEPFGLITGISITMQQAAAYIAMNDPQDVNRDVFKGNDRVTGSIFDDYLDGWGGSDWLYGGAGNDTYVVDNVGDRIVEASNNGIDTVLSSVNYTLSANVENMVLQGDANLSATGNASANTLTGNAGANTLDGNAGADILDGGAGADALYGQAGNDTYVVDNLRDRVFEAKGGGTDTVVATTSYQLAAGQEIEGLQLARNTGTTGYTLVGNEFAQTVSGNAGNNKISGGLGNDLLYGKGGADTFVFDTALGPNNVDRIADFSHVDDTIRLSKTVFTALTTGTLAESAFKDVSVSGTVIDRDDRIIYDGRDGKLYYDTNGSDAGGRTLFAVLDNKAIVDHTDFLIS